MLPIAPLSPFPLRKSGKPISFRAYLYAIGCKLKAAPGGRKKKQPKPATLKKFTR